MDLTKHTPGHVALSVKAKRAVWNVVCFCLFRPFPTKIFRPWRIFLLKLFGAKVEWDAEVYASSGFGHRGICRWDIGRAWDLT